MRIEEAAAISLMKDRLAINAGEVNSKLVSVNILKEQLKKRKQLCQLV